MKPATFNNLAIGTRVKLLSARPDYSCGHKTPDGRCYIPSGTVGVIGAVKVPSVYRDGVTFACVDFDFRPAFQDHKGNPAEHWQRKDLPPRFRVAVGADEIELA